MTVSATTSTPRTAPSQPATTAVRPRRLGLGDGGRELGGEVHRPVGEEAGPAGDDGMPVDDPWTPRPAALANDSTAGSRPVSVAGGVGDGPGDRVLGGVLDGAGEPQDVARLVPATVMTSMSVICPVVTVPVLSSTMVSTRRVDSSTSGPLMRMPSWAPRPVPTRSAVGVASPSAHGQAMISTATAAVKALAVGAPLPSQNPSVATASGDDDRDEDGGDAVGEALHGGLAGLCVGDQAGDLGERGVGADPGGPHDEAAAGVDGGAGDRVTGCRPRRARSRR